MVGFAGCLDNLCISNIAVFIISHHLQFTWFIHSIVPHQTITLLQCSICTFTDFALTLSVDEKFSRRIIGVDEYRGCLPFTSRPCPMGKYMKASWQCSKATFIGSPGIWSFPKFCASFL